MTKYAGYFLQDLKQTLNIWSAQSKISRGSNEAFREDLDAIGSTGVFTGKKILAMR